MMDMDTNVIYVKYNVISACDAICILQSRIAH